MGRFVAKYALTQLSNTDSYNRICIDRGTFMQPILFANSSLSLDISITHKHHKVAAIAFPKSHPMGIDLEKIEQSSHQTLESQMTQQEIQAVATIAQDYLNAICQLWVIKEAISKVLKTGLTTSFLLFETCNHSFNKSGELSCYFSHFYQYHAQSWILNDHALAVVYPRTASFAMDIQFNSTSNFYLRSNFCEHHDKHYR
jgi:phosphopantetheinyl transferase